jgi:hypothetical protein
VHTVHVKFEQNALERGEFLLGEITIREGKKSRLLWLSGTVMDSPPPPLANPLCLMVGKTALYASPSGLILNNALMESLGISGMPDNTSLRIATDYGGLLAILTAETSPAGAQVNNRLVPPRARTLLRAGDTLAVGDVVFNVKPGAALPARPEQTALIFDDFSASVPAPLKLSIGQPKILWNAELISAVPWLSIDPPGLMRLPPTRPHTWTLTLNAEALSLGDGFYDVPSGVLMRGDGVAFAIDIQLRVARPDVALNIAPAEISAVEHGLRSDATYTVHITNFGRAAWEGTLFSNLPWITVLNPQIRGESWAAAQAEITMVPDWDAYAPGVHLIPDAFTCTLEDEETSQKISLQMEVAPPQGRLYVPYQAIDFGEVDRNEALPSLDLVIHNQGGASWLGTVRATGNWLAVEPAMLNLAPQSQQTLTLSLAEMPKRSSLNKPLALDNLIFQDGQGNMLHTLPVRLTLVENPPYIVASPVNFPPFVRGDQPPEATLNIRNLGPSEWRGTINTNVADLNAGGRNLQCKPNESLNVPISLGKKALASLKTGLTRWENALTISGGRAPVEVSVQVDMRETPTELIVETPLLNFGEIGSDILNAPTDTIRLLNAGVQDWQGQAQINVPFFAFDGTTNRSIPLIVAKSTMVELKIVLTEAILDVQPGLNNFGQAITLSNGDRRDGEHHIGVMLLAQEVTPHLQCSPQTILLTDQFERKITITNQGVKAWSLAVEAVAWLAVEPTQFKLEGGQSTAVTITFKPQGIQQADLPQLKESGLGDPRAVVMVGAGREYAISVNIAEGLLRLQTTAPQTPEAPPNPPNE